MGTTSDNNVPSDDNDDDNNDNNNDKNYRKARDEQLAHFHLKVYSRARELQKESIGLLSDENAVKLATWERFTQAVITIKNCMTHMRLFGGESKNEEISQMIEFASAASANDDYNDDIKGIQLTSASSSNNHLVSVVMHRL